MATPTPVQQLATLQEQVANLQAQVEALQTAARTSRPKPILPDPVKFDGKAYHFDTWLPSIKAKLRVDGTSGALGDSIAQFYYVYDRLESNVQSQVLPQLAAAEEAQYWSHQTILDQLARALDNPNKTQEAVDRLYRIKQSSGESIPNYIAKFKRLLYKAKGHNWDDNRKITAFRFGLNFTIKNKLAQ
jgi:Retrotransposon gag protein